MHEKVMVVDPEENLRDLYKHELENEGFDIVVAGTGEEALTKVSSEQVDLLVLELELRDGPGLDYLQQFVKSNRALKVIINTDYPRYKSDFRSWIADAFLTKSFDLRLLKKTIKRLLLSETTRGRKEDDGRTGAYAP